ncbi:MAG: hypothetical protein K6T65_08540 [Peptococcaceae bacterium]|nr:hypothetical protein [Peptococcaceae bacterium]
MDVQYIKEKLTAAFNVKQAGLLAEIIAEATREAGSELVKASDFNELKEIVRDLALAQHKTELRMEELAEAQKRTEQRLEELAEAQKKTEKEMRRLVREVGGIKTELGGLSSSMGYALENEAYRVLPDFLKNYGIELEERFVRREVRGEEINLLARGKRDGSDVVIVGESGLRLTSAGKKIGQLERKAAAVAKEYPGCALFKILVTHYAGPRVVEKAREKGIVVVQSFEWL